MSGNGGGGVPTLLPGPWSLVLIWGGGYVPPSSVIGPKQSPVSGPAWGGGVPLQPGQGVAPPTRTGDTHQPGQGTPPPRGHEGGLLVPRSFSLKSHQRKLQQSCPEHKGTENNVWLITHALLFFTDKVNIKS